MLELQQFLKLGLSDTEARVYFDFAGIGKSTPQILSKRTNIARTSVYWALDNLAAKGLVSIEKKRKTTFYVLNNPQSLMRMVSDEKSKLLESVRQKEDLAKQLISVIQPLISGQSSVVPKLQFFEGKKGIEALLYDNVEIWQDRIFEYDRTWWGYQDDTFAESYYGWLEHTWKIRRKDEIDKILTNDKGVEKKLAKVAPFRGVRFVPKEYEFSSTIWVLGDYIVLFMTAQEPHYAFQLQNENFAKNLRTIFQILWNVFE